MKFVFVANLSWNFYNYRLPLITALKEAGHEVVLLAPRDGYTSRLTTAGFRTAHVPMSQRGTNPLSEAATLLHIYRFYRLERPDIVHHFTPKAVIYGSLAARAAGVPRIINTITGLGYVFTEDARRDWSLRPLTLQLYRIALANTVVLFQSAADMSRLTTLLGGGGKNFKLLAGSPVNLAKFKPEPEPEGTPVVMMAGRLLREKGVEYFVEGARILRRDAVPARFVLVGKPDEGTRDGLTTPRIRAWADEGVLEWWGWRDDMEVVYPQAHIVCLPTYYAEGVPRSLVEAAACGRAIVATDIPGCRQVVRHGENGLLVPPRDAPRLAEAIGLLLRDPKRREAMGAKGREIAMRDFTSKQHLAEYFAVYGLSDPAPQD